MLLRLGYRSRYIGVGAVVVILLIILLVLIL
jgi:hypothetical protein